MGHQIIRQPDGKLAVYSSGVDAWMIVDSSPEELLDYYAERAADDARRSARRTIDAVLADAPQQVYYQFAMTFDEANAQTCTGFLWRDGRWEGNPVRVSVADADL